MTIEEALWQDPERCSGAVCFRGTRIMVSILFDDLASRDGLQSFRDNYPDVTEEQIQAVLDYSRKSVDERFLPRIAA